MAAYYSLKREDNFFELANVMNYMWRRTHRFIVLETLSVTPPPGAGSGHCIAVVEESGARARTHTRTHAHTHTHAVVTVALYEGVSKSFRTGRQE